MKSINMKNINMKITIIMNIFTNMWREKNIQPMSINSMSIRRVKYTNILIFISMSQIMMLLRHNKMWKFINTPMKM